jgi:hypothetical protein
MICSITQIRSGACDRLRQVTFCGTLALLRGDTELIIHERRTAAGPYLTTELLQIDGLTLRIEEKRFPAPPSALDAVGMTATTSEISIKTVIRHRPNTPEIRISDEALLKAWKTTYSRIRPLGPTSNALAAIFSANVPYIGIHCRLGDKVHSKSSRPRWKHSVLPAMLPPILDDVCDTAAKFARVNHIGNVFIAADTRDGFCEIALRLQNRDLSIVHQVAHYDAFQFRQTTAPVFACDLFGLARCVAVFGTIWSGVGQTAVLINGCERYYTAYPAGRIRWIPT